MKFFIYIPLLDFSGPLRELDRTPSLSYCRATEAEHGRVTGHRKWQSTHWDPPSA